MSFLREALKGAKADIDSAGSGLLPRLARTARVARILGVELAAIVALAPYGLYAMSVYRRLPAVPLEALPASSNPPPPSATQPESMDPLATGQAATAQPAAATAAPLGLVAALRRMPPGRDAVAVHRQVSYGPSPRNTLDVYVPMVPLPGAAQLHRAEPAHRHPQVQEQPGRLGQQGQGQGRAEAEPLLPVVFFVHGGVWASGETWQYAPMATRLAQAGLVVVVPTYTLYPEALTGTMVEEVSGALSWTFDNVRQYGGDPSRVIAAGHSAGGHLVAWALLRRAAAAQAAAEAAAAAADLGTGPSPRGADGTVLPYDSPPGLAVANPTAAVGAVGVKRQQGDTWLVQQPQQREQEALQRRRRQRDEALEQVDEGSAAHGGDRRETAAYLLGGAGPSLPGALNALRAVADVQLHPQPGVDVSYDGDGSGGDGAGDTAAAAAAAAAAARPAHAEVDGRMPTAFVGMSAVYDIAKHYEFEKSRAVHELSMMKRAVGGPAGFAPASPAIILAAAADDSEAAARAAAGLPPAAAGGDAMLSYFKSFELLGDAIPARAGLTDLDELSWGADAYARQRRIALEIGMGPIGGGGRAVASPPPPPEARFTVAAARRLPPFVVMGSCADHMVPWHEGAELVHQLRRCGVPVRHLLYNHVGHGDFVMAWRPLDLRPPEDEDDDDEDDEDAGGSETREAVLQGEFRHQHQHRQQEQQARQQPQQEQPQRAYVSAEEAARRDEGLRGLLPCAKDFLRIALGSVRPIPGTGTGAERGTAGSGAVGSGTDAAGLTTATPGPSSEAGLVGMEAAEVLLRSRL